MDGIKESEKKKFGFVVLHYCTLDMTKKCIAAIQEKMAQADYEIVVVDNASGNGTGKDLAECYKDTEHVSVLLSKENLGFAKGNQSRLCICKRRTALRFYLCNEQ